MKKKISILKDINTAAELFNSKKYEEAANKFLYILGNIENKNSHDIYNALQNLGYCYYYLNNYDSSIKYFEQALKYEKGNANIYNMLGYMYFNKNIDKSIEYYLKKMDLKPEIKLFVTLAQVMIKNNNYSQKDLKNIFEKYVNIFRPQILNNKKPYSYDKKKFIKNKKLKIGYMSSDFHCHAMMSFVLPIIENHSYDKFDIILYSTNAKSDITTDRLKNTGATFRNCSDLSNKELAELIHNDHIDILIDLSGYTHNAIWSLLFKPAPIIGQYLGFLGTYGIKETDYIICDEFTIPKEISKYYTEKPLYLTCGMNRFSFNIKNQKLPDIKNLPYEKNNYITFGSYNSQSKINSYTINLWSKVLKEIPKSKLIIYRTQLQNVNIDRIKKQFKMNHIEENRIIFISTPIEGGRFNAYALCDIALDTYPFSGLTITIELAHMGIPTLTLVGETISAKGTARVNKSLNLEEFIAYSEDEFINKVVEITSNIKKLKQYRFNLREKIQNSSICTHYKEYTQELEKNYTKIWHDFCNKNRTKKSGNPNS